MANTPVEFRAPSGLTLTLKLFPYGSDSIANGAGGDSCAEATNCKGRYSATVDQGISGWHDAVIQDGSSNLIATGSVYMENDTAIKRVHDAADRIWPVENGAIPTAASDAAGGLPISDAGGLDLDAQIGTNIDNLVSRLGTPSNLGGGATIAANLSDIEAQTDDIGTAGAGLTAIPWNAAWDAEVQSEVSDELTARGITAAFFAGITSLAQWLGLIAGKQTGNSTARTELRATGAGSGTFDETTDSLEAERDNIGTAGAGLTAADDATLAAIAALNNLSAAQVNAEADAALADVGLTTIVTGRVDVAVSTRLAGASYTAPPSAASIAAAVWDYLTSAATTAGSIGKWIVDKLDVVLSTRLASGSYTAPDNSGIAAAAVLASTAATQSTAAAASSAAADVKVGQVKTQTDKLTFDGSNRLSVFIGASAAIFAGFWNKIADHVRRRNQVSVQASSDGDTIDVNSEYGMIQLGQKSNATDNAGKVTVYNPDGSELAQLDFTSESDADVLTGIGT